MSYYPEDLPTPAICQMEGCDYKNGGICIRCGDRLRCMCGQFITTKGFDTHICPKEIICPPCEDGDHEICFGDPTCQPCWCGDEYHHKWDENGEPL